jgi:bifunctional non-homologous end joining protein LigD
MSIAALKSASRKPFRVAGARDAPMPHFIEPCDPTLHEHAPVGRDWVYEIKSDGYRAQVHIRQGEVTIYSRSGYDWTEQFAAIGRAGAKLKVREAIIDGEATVLGNKGLPDFQALRRELRSSTAL